MRCYRSLILIATILTLGACNVSSPAADTPSLETSSSTPRASSLPVTPTIDCPSQEIGNFVRVFAERGEIQKQFTVQPLRMDSLDADAQPEPRQISREVPGNEISFPVMPNFAEQRQGGLEMDVRQADDKEAEVILRKPDTGYQLAFMFRKGSCWQLYRISDDSL